MALYVPKKVVYNWFQHDLVYTIELLAGYVKEIDIIADESQKRLKDSKIIIPLDDEREIENYLGLDSETWDLQGVVTSYFPNLQRRSAFITITSFFENEFDKLCDLYKKQKEFEIELRDLYGKGFERAANYIQKVAGVNIYKESPEWKELKLLQKLRNVIIHQNGKIDKPVGNDYKELVAYIEGNSYLKIDENEVFIEKGFLMYVLISFSKYFFINICD